MRCLWPWSFLLCFVFSVTIADASEEQELSTIKSIDDLAMPPSDEASEEGLPTPELLRLLERAPEDGFTVISEARARDIFSDLERNPRARMPVAGGKCSYRRSYIQGYLRKLGISSGRLYIQCPSNRGKLRLRDQVTGRRYTFSNFHDTNVVSVRRSSRTGLDVLDVQFLDRPYSLQSYLGLIEASQKLKPLRGRSSGDRGYCYWSVR